MKALTDDEIGLAWVAGVQADDDGALPQGGVLCESPETLGHPAEDVDEEVVVDPGVMPQRHFVLGPRIHVQLGGCHGNYLELRTSSSGRASKNVLATVAVEASDAMATAIADSSMVDL